MKEQQVLFVYNVNSDLFSAASGWVHKILSPSSYQCHLCTLTYGDFFVKQEWKSFTEMLPVKTVFLHKDEFAGKSEFEVPLPAVFFQSEDGIKEIISQAELNSFQSLDELKNSVLLKVESYVKRNYSNL